MTHNHPAVPEDEDRGMTFNERLVAYQGQPKLLMEDLEIIFGPNMTADGMVLHRVIVDRISELCPDRNILLSRVARAILHAAQIHHARKG